MFDKWSGTELPKILFWIMRNFDVLFSVIGSREEEKWLPWIDDVAPQLDLAYCSWKPKLK